MPIMKTAAAAAIGLIAAIGPALAEGNDWNTAQQSGPQAERNIRQMERDAQGRAYPMVNAITPRERMAEYRYCAHVAAAPWFYHRDDFRMCHEYGGW